MFSGLRERQLGVIAVTRLSDYPPPDGSSSNPHKGFAFSLVTIGEATVNAYGTDSPLLGPGPFLLPLPWWTSSQDTRCLQVRNLPAINRRNLPTRIRTAFGLSSQ